MAKLLINVAKTSNILCNRPHGLNFYLYSRCVTTLHSHCPHSSLTSDSDSVAVSGSQSQLLTNCLARTPLHSFSSQTSVNSTVPSHCPSFEDLDIECKSNQGHQGTRSSSGNSTLSNIVICPLIEKNNSGSLSSNCNALVFSNRLRIKNICCGSAPINTNNRPANLRSLHSLVASKTKSKPLNHSLALNQVQATPNRTKYNKSSVDDDESGDEYEDSDDEHFYEEDANLPHNYRDITVHVKSLRLDAILAQGLNVARNKVDEHFLGSNLELNGQRVLKKGKQLSEGDFIDVITSQEEDARKFKRVRITNVSNKTTKSDRKMVKLRVWRANIIEKKD